MIKIIFYQPFESKEVKYRQSNKEGAENSPWRIPPLPAPRRKNISSTGQFKCEKITKKFAKNNFFFHIVIQTVLTQLFL